MAERVYELRTYTTLPGRLPALNKRFKDHTMKLFEKHGMKNEVYWVPTDPKRQFEILFRLYGPKKSLFEKTWKLPDIEQLN